MSAKGGARVLIVTALPEELAAFEGQSLPRDVILAKAGDGPLRATRELIELCKRHRPSLVIGAGVAGGLTADLGTGDLVVAHRVLDAAGEVMPSPDPTRVIVAAAKPGARQGTLVSVEAPVVSADEKASLAARYGPPPAAVDMESSAWARVAAARGIPYLIVRIVTDTAEDDLPGYLSRCMTHEGSIRRSSVAFGALVHPRSIPSLLRLRRQVADCADRVASFVASLVAERI